MKFCTVISFAVVVVLTSCAAQPQYGPPELAPGLSQARLEEIAAQRKALAKDASGEPTLLDYFRVVSAPSADGSKTWTLQTSVRVLRLDKSNSTIMLVATSHIGTPCYWRSLSAVLERSRVVLNEGIDGSGAHRKTGRDRETDDGKDAVADQFVDVLIRYNRVLARIAGLVEEIVWEMEAWREGWIRADLNWNEFKAQLEAKPEGKPEGKWSAELFAPFAKYVRELEAFKPDLISDASRAQVVQAYVAAVLQKLPISNSPGGGAWRELGAAREKVVMVKLREVLEKSGDDPASVAIRYGAAHIPHIERAIRANESVTLISHVWVDVLTARQERPEQAAEAADSDDDSAGDKER